MEQEPGVLCPVSDGEPRKGEIYVAPGQVLYDLCALCERLSNDEFIE